MKQKLTKWELLFVIGLMLVLVVGVWGTSGSGLDFASAVLAGNAPQVTTAGGSGAQPGIIVTPGTGTGKVMPAVLSGSGAAGQVTFWTGTESLSGDNDFYWDNTNKRLGIGTASPLRKLHYYGDAALFQRDVDAAGFIIQRTDTNRWVFGASENPSLGTGFSIYTYPVGAPSATPRLFLDLDGRVGIGTTSPDSLAKLHVVSSDETLNARAVYGETTATSSNTHGVWGKHSTTGNQGYLGGGNWGVYGYSNVDSTSGYLGGAYGAYGKDNTSTNYGYLGGSSYGVYGRYDTSGPYGYLGGEYYGAYGRNNSNWGSLGTANYAVYGSHSGGNWGYIGDTDYGVLGAHSGGNWGYLGSSTSGVHGESSGGVGVSGDSETGDGVYGHSTSGNAVYGEGGSGYAGFFDGRLGVSGSIEVHYTEKTDDYTATSVNSIIGVNSGDSKKITLPSAAGIKGRLYTIKRIGAGAVTVEAAPSETIDGASSYPIPLQYDFVTVVSDGDEWLVVGK